LIAVVAQTPEVGSEIGARLAYERGLQDRCVPATAEQSCADFLESATHLEGFRDHNSTTLELALGNARFLSDNLPAAIAAYRRGHALDPTDGAIFTALTYARNQVRYPPAADRLHPEGQIWPPWLALRSLGVATFVVYCVGCAALTRWRMVRRRRWLIVAVVSLAIAAVPAVGSGIEWWRARRDAAEPIVVVTRDLPLGSGNGADYPTRAELPRGCELRRHFERSGWLQVETGGGLIGWVPADAVVD
jgi:hypothetical protein